MSNNLLRAKCKLQLDGYEVPEGLSIKLCFCFVSNDHSSASHALETHCNNFTYLKASLTFKCMTEHLFADFSYSIALDTYL